jgi:hypothetical protein
VLEVAIAVSVTGLVFTIAGIPFALSIRRDGEGWWDLATDAAALGVVFVTLAITAWAWLGPTGIVLAILVFAAFIYAAIRHRTGLPRRWRPTNSRGWWLAALWVAVIIAAVLLRLHNVNFLPWVGDMGAYVNWANEFVRTGVLAASWPPIFSVFLSVSTAVFGTAGTTSGIAFTGLLLIAVITRLLRQLSVNRWGIVAVAGALAFNVHAIWYSSFPSSESLNAPLFTMWLSLLLTTIRMRKAQLPAVLGASFLVMLNLCLLRGSGSFLLAPLVALGVASAIIGTWRRWSPRIWLYIISCIAAASVGVWYGVSAIPRYFVDMQVGYLLPSSLFDIGKSSGLFSPSPILLGALLALLALGVCGWWIASRVSRSGADSGGRSTRVLALLAGGALAVGLALECIVGANIWFIFVRAGLWIAVIPIITMIAVGRRRIVGADTPVLFLAMATALMLIAFHTPRVGNNRSHAFFIYWDRYLVSEVIPALVVISGVGVGILITWAATRTRQWRVMQAGWMTTALTAVTIAAITIPNAPSLSLVMRDTYMSGAYSFTQRLLSHVDDGDALLWGATSPDAAPGFFFPNTWMAFAVPMQRSFGATFLNVDQSEYNFAPDDVISLSELREAVAQEGTALVFETQTAYGPPLIDRIDPAILSVTRVAEETSDISLLAQRPQLADWTHAHIHVAVWSVQAARP